MTSTAILVTSTAILRRLGAITALVGLGAALVFGGAALTGPPAWGVGSVAEWATAEPLDALLRLLGAGGLVAVLWLLAVTLGDTAGIVVRSAALSRLARRCAPAMWRAVVLRPVVVFTLATPQLAVPTMALAATVPAVEEAALDDSGPRHLVMVRDADAPVLTMRVSPEPHVGPAEPVEPTLQVPASTAATHTVQAGDNLWSIAQAHLEASADHPPAPAAVTSYWRDVIDTNRHVLPDPDNADLLFPGTVITLPPL